VRPRHALAGRRESGLLRAPIAVLHCAPLPNTAFVIRAYYHYTGLLHGRPGVSVRV
jgi:hypothetical protein